MMSDSLCTRVAKTSGLLLTMSKQIVDGPVRSVGIVTRRARTSTAIAQQAMQEVRAVTGALIERKPEWVLPPSARRVRRLL